MQTSVLPVAVDDRPNLLDGLVVSGALRGASFLIRGGGFRQLTMPVAVQLARSLLDQQLVPRAH
jgi:hypothetical protein